MKRRKTIIFFSAIVLALTLTISPLLVNAQQAERPCFTCNEDINPIPINYGDRRCECQINGNNDLDVFNFDGADGDKVRFMVKNLSNAEFLQIEVYDTDGDRILITQVNNAYIDRDLLESGVYTIIISDHLQNDSGYSYILHVEKIPPDDEHTCLEYDSTECDRIDYPTDMDFFYFNSAESTRVRFQLTNQSNAEFLQIEVYDTDGDRILITQVNNAYIDRDLLEPGVYTIVISDHLRDTTALSDYCLQIQCLLGGCPHGLCPEADCDEDGILDDGDGNGTAGDNPCLNGIIENCDDNCRCTPNGPDLGSCINTATGAVGLTCMNDGECGTGETCSNDQEDRDNDGDGDACGIGTFCRGLADYDSDVDADDVEEFLNHFGRFEWNNPCPPDGPAPVEKTGQTTCYDDIGNLIDCAGTSQDGEYQKGVAWPNPRFTDHEDETVTDNLTGLMWLQDANCIATNYPSFDNDDVVGDGGVILNNAINFIKGINDGTYPNCGSGNTDWRLANKNELFSLIDIGNVSPALPSGHPFNNVQINWYWSSNKWAQFGQHGCWVIMVYDGKVDYFSTMNDFYVWPVRGGH